MKICVYSLTLAICANCLGSANPDLGTVLRPLGLQRMLYLPATWHAPAIADAPNDRQARAEIDYLLSEEGKRTVDDTFLVARENSSAIEDLTDRVAGSYIQFPHTHTLVNRAAHDVSTISANILLEYQFRRPCDFDDRLHPAIAPDPVFAYPSAFTVNVTVTVRLLEACAQKPLPEAKKIAHAMVARRLIAGLEWPSALNPAVSLGNSIAEELLKTRAIQTQLELARSEWSHR